MRWIRAVAACLGFLVLSAGCANQQTAVYDVQDKPLPSAARSLSAYQIEAYINQATATKGWTVDKIRPGELRAAQNWDRYTAVVTILFTQQTYSLRHHDSSSLRDGEGYVYRQYNARVRALEDEIDRRLKAASS